MSSPVARISAFMLGGIVAAWCLVQPAHAASPPDCMIGFVGDIRKTVGDADEADEIFSRIHAFSDDAARGSALAVRATGGDRFATLFDNLDHLESLGRSPFADDQDVFTSIARMMEARPNGNPIAGADGIIGHLATENVNDAQGALFGIFVARSRGAGSFSTITAIEKNFDGLGHLRRVDVVEGLIHHECKSWSEVVANATDGRLRALADREFPSDVLLHRGNNFSRYKLHFPDKINTPEQLVVIKAELMKQFETNESLILELGGEQAALVVQESFSAAWDQGLINVFHHFSTP